MRLIEKRGVCSFLAVILTAGAPLAFGQEAADKPVEKATAADAAAKEDGARQGEKAEAKPDEKKEEESAEDKKRKRLQGLEVAHLEEQIMNLDVQMKMAAAEQSVAEAERTLSEARLALKVYEGSEAPTKIEEAKIRLDRSKYNAEHSEDELNELKAMYDAEEFAEMTKELVLKRAVRNLELARRNLQVDASKLEMLTSHEIPTRIRELSQKVHLAELALEKARTSRSKAELENRLSQTKLRHKIEELERDK